ncbi:MAG: hypothetical protein Q7U98_01745 [Methylicorpusculum sp.]|uniref:hypothetical protein n=1 Tax=Methylicorpusculum sp. TaxID=2713644 RepID=UPI002727F5C1|nr:hypothetical protein [Methylicorpusculum sp.]MDO8937863.1 hypothetical protein [Methylicorpusculum sp.]
MSESKRKIVTGVQKAKVALAAVRRHEDDQCSESFGPVVCEDRAPQHGAGLA